jgi:hypothetical protein
VARPTLANSLTNFVQPAPLDCWADSMCRKPSQEPPGTAGDQNLPHLRVKTATPETFPVFPVLRLVVKHSLVLVF